MKKFIRWFNSRKLNIKFTLIIGIIILVPVIIIYIVLFGNMQRTVTNSALNEAETAMNQRYADIKKRVEMCNFTNQYFITNQNLKEFLINVYDKDRIDTSYLIDFYNDVIPSLESLVYSNSYLYQVRVYAKNNDFRTEMKPILYNETSMKRFAWAGEYVSGEWQFDYRDVIGTNTLNAAKHMMSMITVIEDFDRGEIGVVETAARMEDVFPEIYEGSGEQWACFVDKNGRIYLDQEPEEPVKWSAFADGIYERCKTSDGTPNFISAVIDGEKVVLSYMPIKELSGGYVKLRSLNGELNTIRSDRNLYLAGLLCAFVILFIIINLVVKALLKNFYVIMNSIRQVQRGDLGVRIDCRGTDEMGELGIQVNKMLDHISELMNENLRRELLVKNSEIRALQNQINAHFIYNVLESIKMMAEIKEEYVISDAVTSLGRLLRYSIRWTNKNVTVAQEIDYIKDYLELLNLRFDYEIRLALNMPELVYQQEIPKMSLQPIIENAIYHGIEELGEDASIYVKGFVHEDYCTIEITDTGKGMREEEVVRLRKKISGEIEVGGGSGNGIGLKNVQDRIQITFGQEFGISVASKIDCFTKVIIKIPMKQSNING